MEDITLISLISLCFGFIIVICKLIYKSKCSECEIFYGFFRIKRDTKGEIEEHKYDVENNVVSNNELSNLKNVIK